MRVSVIVPLYNKAHYIRRALDSIAAQTFSDFEVIVIDDGSTDGGAALARAYPDPRVRVLVQENQGPGGARNRGVREARGELLAFLDADDEWTPEYLSTSVRLLGKAGSDVATITSGYVELPGGWSRESMWRNRGIRQGRHRVHRHTSPLLLHYMLAYMVPCSTVARAEVVRRHNGFFEKNRCVYGEDASLCLKILLNEAVYLNLQPLIRIHREASALSSNYTGPRPVEPFLVDPNEMAAVCPPELLQLLRGFYALRACKTAIMLGYWGNSEGAWHLFKRFVSVRDWRSPYFVPALLGCTPALSALRRWVLPS